MYKGCCLPIKRCIIIYAENHLHSIPHTKYVYIKVSIMFIYVVLDVVYIYNYDTMSLLNTYVTRIHTKSRIHILDITICHTLTYMHNHTYKHTQTLKIV